MARKRGTEAKRIAEAKRLIGLALEFWSAPGIDLPDIDTFDDMTVFMGVDWASKWDKKGRYIGKPIKPVGMTIEEFEVREAGCEKLAQLEDRDVWLREKGWGELLDHAMKRARANR